MADRTPVSRDPEDERADLLATLAAARELGPDMDKSIVDSYLERRKSEARAGVVPSASANSQGSGPSGQGIMPHQTPGTPSGIAQAAGMIFPLAGIAVYVVLLIVSKGELWWAFWLPMLMGGWWRGMWYPRNRYAYRAERQAMRDDYRQARRDARYRYRYDDHYDRRRDDDLD